MTPAETAKVQIDAAAAVPLPEISLWSVIWDPTFLFLLVAFVGIFAFSQYNPLARRFVRKQTDYLDHQRDVNEKALAQNKAMEDIIAQQYSETNARSDRAYEQSAEALRLHAEALEQLKGMNSAITRLYALIEQERGSRSA